jgi:hypothetical protein
MAGESNITAKRDMFSLQKKCLYRLRIGKSLRLNSKGARKRMEL